MGFTDFLNGLGSVFNSISPLVNLGVNLYRGFGGGGGQQQQGPSFDPAAYMNMMQGMFQPPDMSWLGEMMGAFQEQMGAQQEALMKQQQAFQDDQKKGLARQAASTRKQLQGQGVYGDPAVNIGAAGSDALASVMGVSPEELLKALKQYGGEFGFADTWTS